MPCLARSLPLALASSLLVASIAGSGSSAAPATADASSGDGAADAPAFPRADAVTGDGDLTAISFSPGSPVLGRGYTQWTEEYWKWLLQIPKATSPLFGGDCAQGQSGPMWFLVPGQSIKAGVRACTIPASAAILVPLAAFLCFPCPEDDAACAIPTAETDLRKCVRDYFAAIDTMQLVVDGKRVGDGGSDFILYRAQSSLFSWKAPAARAEQAIACTGPVPKNACSVPEGDRQGVSDGYWVILQPLSPGQHTLYWSSSLLPASDPPVKASVAWDLTITP
ncbi:MAG: hypothetical protein NVSMB47_10320 [Polyangiales bacterium]